VFTRSGSSWSQQGGKLVPSGASGASSFGYDVAMSTDGNTALIGAPDDNGGIGAAYLFTRSGSTWSQSGSKLTASGEAGAGTFGIAVALSSDANTGLIGGPDDNNTFGAAWAFANPIPLAPTGVSAVAGANEAAVSFTPSLGATSYTVTSSPGGIQATGASSPIVVPGLTAGQAYTFTVTATNSFGTSPASAASNSVTPFTTPGPPTGVSATPGDGYATVAFTPPASDGGSAILHYTVTASPGGQTANGTGSPIAVYGLTNGVSYTFTLTATNAGGAGAASAPSNSVTPDGTSRPGTDPPAVPVPRVAVPDPPPAGPRVPPP
jgi:hypothetical protein